MPIVDFDDPAVWDTGRIWRIGTGFYLPGSGPDWREVKLNFHRAVIMPENIRRAPMLIKNLGIGAGDRVLLMGDVYGWTAESLRTELPPATFVACDSGTLTQARKTQTETAAIRAAIAAAGVDPDTGRGAEALAALDDELPRARVAVLDEDAASNRSRNAIRNVLGGLPTYALTVGMCNFLIDTEAAQVSANLHEFTGVKVAHIINPFDPRGLKRDDNGDVVPEPRPYLNWKHISGVEPRVDYLDAELSIGVRSWKGLLPNDWVVPDDSYNAYF